MCHQKAVQKSAKKWGFSSALSSSSTHPYPNEKTTDTCLNMNESQKHYAKWQTSDEKDYLCYNVIEMECLHKE